MKVYIRTITQRLELDLLADDSIEDIKCRIKKAIQIGDSIPSRLVYQGRVIPDNMRLKDVLPSVSEHDTLFFIYSLQPQSVDTDEMEIQPTEIPETPLPESLQSIVNNIAGAFTQQVTSNRAASIPSATGGLVQDLLAEATEALNMLLEMGFPENRAKKALLLNGMDVQQAMEWLLNHLDDPTIDDPLTEDDIRAIRHNLQMRTAVASAAASIQNLQQCITQGRCTFTVTGREYFPQRWYSCYTCGIVDTEGVCESCKNICHRGHMLSEPRETRFYCDCGASGSCKCCPPH